MNTLPRSESPEQQPDPWRNVTPIRPDWREYERRKAALPLMHPHDYTQACKRIARELGL